MKCLNGLERIIYRWRSLLLGLLLALFSVGYLCSQTVTVSVQQLQKFLQQIQSLETNLQICKTQITNGQASISNLQASLTELTTQYQALQLTASQLQVLCQMDKQQLATASLLQDQLKTQFDNYKKQVESKIAELERDKWLYAGIGAGSGAALVLILHGVGVIK